MGEMLMFDFITREVTIFDRTDDTRRVVDRPVELEQLIYVGGPADESE